MRNLHTAPYKQFLARLVAERERKGVNQREAARAMKIPQSRLSRMESGQTRVDVLDIDAFMRYYKKSFRYFVPAKR